MRSAEIRRARRGFTLVELMVALVIGALLITIIMRVVMGQTRFASVQSSREEVQQNARGALEVVGSELRGAIPAGIVVAQQQELVLAAPRHWGVACGIDGGNLVGLFPQIPGFSLAPSARWGLLARTGNDPWRGTVTSGTLASKVTITSVAATVLGPAAPPAVCAGLAPEGSVMALRFGANNLAPLGTINPGDVIVAYELVRFDVAATDGVSWLRRSNGWTSGGTEHGFGSHMQPLAGPVDPDALSFTYLGNDPPTALTFPVTPADVRMVRFSVRTLTGRPLDGTIQQAEEGAVTVHLRN